ncbi:RHS repeat-associated core domain-containing protein [Cellulomonas dongxiuzhuiae]|uniref:RHS repeat-associated core domain-containing protein n=1 Tax=Cellulomonas dongxiuzhuiae TaxID=2819979 RepID=UPI001AAF801B|nr:RHS repeat-associated core domain-containing protein [Cellulomonas dongxiuzhuiae]MBO3087836.1 hypothetical protein [Cellulomonas dongxiuzhuiae]
MVEAAGEALEYDADGNLLSDGSRSFVWDELGRLVSVDVAGGDLSFGYSPTGGRSSRGVGDSASGFVDVGANPAVELDGQGQAVAGLLSGGMDQWFARTHAGGTDAVLTDLLGSPVGLGGADGSVSARWSFDPFGVASVSGDVHGADLGFTGRQLDGAGLTFHRARYYDAGLGRFISEDPIGFAGGSNLYAYGANAPTVFTDPTGRNPMLIGCVAGAAFDGGAAYLGERLSGRKVNWGTVGGAAASGCALGALGGWAFRGGVQAGQAANVVDDVCSFDGATLVVMADGSRKPIDEVRVGEMVQAMDPETGGAREVTPHTWMHQDTLVDLTVEGGAALTTTEDHPFWSVTDQRFEAADELSEGERILSADGQELEVYGLAPGSARQALAYNLTVEGIHTYFVGVGDESALVHNTCKVRGLWNITTEGTAATRRGPFGTLWKSKSDDLWWSRDTAGHGGSAWKVYQETPKGLEWMAGADQYGDFIRGKHKSAVGAFIPWRLIN